MDKVMIYHPLGNDVIWGINCKFQTFERQEADELLSREGEEKWYKSPLDFPKAKEADELLSREADELLSREADELLSREGEEKWYKSPLDFPKAKDAD